jgi:hypothetical protein
MRRLDLPSKMAAERYCCKALTAVTPLLLQAPVLTERKNGMSLFALKSAAADQAASEPALSSRLGASRSRWSLGSLLPEPPRGQSEQIAWMVVRAPAWRLCRCALVARREQSAERRIVSLPTERCLAPPRSEGGPSRARRRTRAKAGDASHHLGGHSRRPEPSQRTRDSPLSRSKVETHGATHAMR